MRTVTRRYAEREHPAFRVDHCVLITAHCSLLTALPFTAFAEIPPRGCALIALIALIGHQAKKLVKQLVDRCAIAGGERPRESYDLDALQGILARRDIVPTKQR